MQQQQQEQLQAQIIEITSVLNKVLNLNAAFDGSNIIYVAGANIVFHNVFQNTKHFIERASSYEIVGFACHKMMEVSVALFTRTNNMGSNQCFVQFYYQNKQPVVVQLNQNIELKDMIFTEKKKVCLLCKDNLKSTYMILVISSVRKLKRIELAQPISKFFHNQKSIYVINDAKGCWEFNSQLQALENIRYDSHTVKCLFSIDQAEILVDSNNFIYVFIGGNQIQSIKINDFYNAECGYGVKVGHSLLISFKGEFTIGHFYYFEGKLNWGGSFEYCQRLRANIISMQSSADEMNLALSVQIFYKDSWSIEHFLFNLTALSSEKKFVNAFTRLIPGGSQSGEVVSMQTIIPSQIFLLTGPSIVNYSYLDHIQKKHKYVIHESPRLIAVHPLGHQILCTFQSSIKFYQKIELELVQTWNEQWCCSAAVYTGSGLLLLCIYEQGFHQLVLYNPNSFKTLKYYNNLYLKHGLSKIELDETGTQMILWAGKDFAVHKFKSGERLSEFRQKKQGFDASCVQYDSLRKTVLVGYKKNLALCRKTEDYHLNFTNQKHLVVNEEISCICIKQSIRTAFLGTTNGKVLFASYPFTINEEVMNDNKVFNVQFQSVKIHSCPTTDLLLTNNGKFLFVTSKNQGLAILKIRKTFALGSNYNPFDISNYNFIETSSKPYLESVQQKLKILLQKRKTIFNELDQFKKEWESKRIRETKTMNVSQKKKELQAVNTALQQISRMKEEQNNLKQKLSSLESQAMTSEIDSEASHRKELLVCYDQNDILKQKRYQITARCEREQRQIYEQCENNLREIEEQLNSKFMVFQNNYERMKSNLFNFNKRIEIQRKEDQQLEQQALEQAKERLRKEEEDLLRKNNELKSEITRNKKDLDRFINRRDFLENKQRFFKEQLRYCQSEQHQLKQIKQQLEQELNDLQNVTYKKQKKLRKYFLQNDVLIKYQIIHDNINKTNQRELEFIQKNQIVVKTQINDLQKQIIKVSENRASLNTRIGGQKVNNQKIKDSLKLLKAKREYLELQIKEIERLLATVGSDRQQQLQGLYERFFIEKKLESIIQCRKFEEIERQETKQVENKIKEQLQSYKNYLVNNMNLFEKFNNKAYQEIHLSNAKYQTENYTLINECNTRKQQIAKKKRVFQQMVNDFRETQNYLTHLHNNTLPKSNQSINPSPKSIPFIDYEKQQLHKSHIKKQQSEISLTRTKSPGVQVRKMLDIQKLVSPDSRMKPERRIQTAKINKKPQESTHEQLGGEQEGAMWIVSKPQTAKKTRGAQHQARRLFSRKKSSSKPTTCTSHSKYSVFV